MRADLCPSRFVLCLFVLGLLLAMRLTFHFVAFAYLERVLEQGLVV